jgi:hypothetical protein
MPDENLPAAPLVDDRVQAQEEIVRHGGMWLPGQSGNPAGRPKGAKGHLAQLKRELEIAVRDNLNPKVVRAILERMAEQAMAGDVKAAKLILDKVLTNATDAEEAAEGGGTFVFQVKNLTLKHDSTTPGVVIDVTPQEHAVSTGADQSKQARTEQAQGGNLVGKAPSAPVRTVPDFMGKAGQSDNQSTNRPKGQS